MGFLTDYSKSESPIIFLKDFVDHRPTNYFIQFN
jgi:hypothetical protein